MPAGAGGSDTDSGRTARGRARFLQGAALSALSTGVALLSLLLVGKMATNALPAESVAIFLLALLVADGANLFSNCGIFAAAPKLVAERAGEARVTLISSLCWGQFGQSAITASFLAIGAVIFHNTGYPVWTSVLLWALPLGALGAYRDTLLAVLAGENRYGMHAAASMVLSAGQALLVYVLVWRGEASADRLLLAVVLAQICGVGLLFLSQWKNVMGAAYASEHHRVLIFSAPLYANSLLNFGFQRADTFLVTALLGLPAAALYEIAKRFPQVLSRVLNALILPWLPAITTLLQHGPTPAAARAQRNVLLVIAVLGYMGILLCHWQAQQLVLLIASPDYLPAAALLPWLMLGIHAAVQAGIFGQSLIALGRPAIVTWGNVMQAVCSLGGMALLLPHHGLMGAAVAWNAGAALSLALQAGMAWRMGLRGFLLPWGAVHAAFFICMGLGQVDV